MIRLVSRKDIPALEKIAAASWRQQREDYFDTCFTKKEAGHREIFVFEENGTIAGYVQLVFLPIYLSFRHGDIPEIQDLNVAPDFRRRGIGQKLVEASEDVARAKGKKGIGLGVGLHAGFGAAQRLYARMGYLPDGAGACYDDIPLRTGEIKPLDDFFSLKMIKFF